MKTDASCTGTHCSPGRVLYFAWWRIMADYPKTSLLYNHYSALWTRFVLNHKPWSPTNAWRAWGDWVELLEWEGKFSKFSNPGCLKLYMRKMQEVCIWDLWPQNLLVNMVRGDVSECELKSSKRGSVICGTPSCRLSMCCGTTWGKNTTATMTFSIRLSTDLNQANG
jgi:hypothetical protein